MNYKLLFPVLMLLLSACGGSRYVDMDGYAQGGTYHIRCAVPLRHQPAKVQEAVDAALLRIDKSISGYNQGSLLSAFNRGAKIEPDGCFKDIFNRSKAVWSISEGAFDPSAAPLFDIWGFGFQNGSNPDQAAIDSVMEFVGMEKIRLENGDLVKSDVRCKLNFNAIAQGYSCDYVATVLEKFGISDYIIEIGGEIVTRGKSPRGSAWRIQIDKPDDDNNVAGKMVQDVLSISDCGVVTSGNYRRFYIKDGKKYSHTIDPLTGAPVNHQLLSATVIAKDATAADAYATWFMVVGTDKAVEITLSGKVDDLLGVYLVYAEGDETKVWHTDGIVLDSQNSVEN